MRTLLLILTCLLFDLAGAQTGFVYNPGAIGSAGGSPIIDSSISPVAIVVNTNGASVNMGSNTYTLAYNALPAVGTAFDVIFDATKLTADTSKVTLFGVKPLSKWPNQGFYWIRFVVSGRPGNKTLNTTFVSGMVQVLNVNNAAVFNNNVNIYGHLELHPSDTAAPIGANVVATSDSGQVGFGCVGWCTLGNSGTNSGRNFLGTTDTAGLVFKLNNFSVGQITYLTNNVSFGAGNLHVNTSGNNNAAFGGGSLYNNTTGSQNTGIGIDAAPNVTTGTNNTALGYNSLQNLTIGSGNIGIGINSATAATSTNNSIAVGQGATVGNYGIALGYNATASANQLSISSTIENIYWSGHPSGVGYVLADTTGNGNFVPAPTFGTTGTTFTSVTGDSVNISNNKNTLNSAGTLTNWTLILPANPIAWKEYNFSLLQAVTNIHYSTRLSGGTLSGGLPSSATQYKVFGIYWDPNVGGWLLSHN